MTYRGKDDPLTTFSYFIFESLEVRVMENVAPVIPVQDKLFHRGEEIRIVSGKMLLYAPPLLRIRVVGMNAQVGVCVETDAME